MDDVQNVILKCQILLVVSFYFLRFLKRGQYFPKWIWISKLLQKYIIYI